MKVVILFSVSRDRGTDFQPSLNASDQHIYLIAAVSVEMAVKFKGEGNVINVAYII